MYFLYREREILTLILMVSLGRPGVKTYPVICTENHNNLEFRLGDVDGMQQQIVTCSHLKDLVDYYRLVKLSPKQNKLLFLFVLYCIGNLKLPMI